MSNKEFVEKLKEIKKSKYRAENKVDLYEYKERCLIRDFLSELDKKDKSEVQK